MSILFKFVSPHPGHAVHHPNGAELALFAPAPGRRPTTGVFETTDLHVALRLDAVAEQHDIKRAPMDEKSVQLLEETKKAVAAGTYELPEPEAPPAPEGAEEPADGEPGKGGKKKAAAKTGGA